MSEHLKPEELAAYRGRSLAPAELLRVDDHLAVCEVCRAALTGSVDELTGPWREALQEPGRRQFPVRMFAIAAAVVMCVIVYGTWKRNDPVVARVVDRGAVVEVNAQGRVRGIAGLDGAQERAVREAMLRSKIEPPEWIGALVGRREVLMGSAGKQASPLLSPVGTGVMADRPRFQWKAVPGVREYVVVIQHEASGRLIRSEPVGATEWSPDAALERGERYAWQLVAGTATFPAPPDPPARFQVLDSGTVRRLRGLPASHLDRRTNRPLWICVYQRSSAAQYSSPEPISVASKTHCGIAHSCACRFHPSRLGQ